MPQRGKRLRDLLPGLLALILFSILAGCQAGTIRSPDSAPAPSWNGITPGQTTLQEAQAILGAPDEETQRGDYLVYRYEARESWGGRSAELWAKPAIEVVVAVFRDKIPGETPSDIRRLSQLVLAYGRPALVTWRGDSDALYPRCLIWARQGVAAEVDRSGGWSAPVGAVLLYEPMTLEQVLQTSWPWPAGPLWSSENPFPVERYGHDMADDWPQDPYDWAHMPTLVPVSQAPFHVEQVGKLDGRITAIVRQGQHVYVGKGLRLIVLDIADPARPAIVGQMEPPDQVRLTASVIRNIVVAGDYAYIAAEFAGVWVVDIRNPAAPIPVGFYAAPLGAATTGVAVAGQYAYVAAGEGGLRTLDVADPRNPREVAFADSPTLEATDVKIIGNSAYVAGGKSGMWVVDITAPLSPTVNGHAMISDIARYARSLAVVANYAYVAAGDAGLNVFDLADPRLWQIEAKDVLAPRYTYYSQKLLGAWDVVVEGRYAYVAYVEPYTVTEQRGGLRIWDISDPAAVVEVGAYDTEHGALGVAVVGPYAYLAADEDGLLVLQVSP